MSSQELQNHTCKQHSGQMLGDRSSTATLTESEERLLLALKAAGVGVWDWNIETGEVSCCQTTASLLCLAPGLFNGSYEAFFQHIHPQDRDRVSAAIQSALKQGANYKVNYRTIWSDGSIHWLKGKGDVIRNEIGKPVLMTGTFMDISDRKQIEEELQRSQAMLQLVMDNIPQSIFWKDRNSVYLGCNRNFAAIAGLETPEDIVGKTDYDLPWKPEEADWFRECDTRVISADAPEYHIIEPQLTANGKQTWIDTNKIPLHDSQGNVVGIIGTFEDITVRKEAEEALKQVNKVLEIKVKERTTKLRNTIKRLQSEMAERQRSQEALQESEARFRNIIENANDIIYSLSKDGIFTYVSPQWTEILGDDISEVEGRSFIPFVHPDDLLVYTDFFNKAIQTSQKQSGVEYRVKHQDGSWRWMTSNASAVKDESGNILYYVGIARDISDRQQVEEELLLKQFSIDTVSDSIYWLGSVGQFFDVNDAACRQLGYSREELLSMSIFDIVPNFPTAAWPEHWEEIKQFGSFTFETINKAKDGRVFPVEVTVNYLEFKGEEYNCSFARDISDRKQAEEALRESEAMYMQILDAIPDMVLCKESRSRIVYANKAFREFYDMTMAQLRDIIDAPFNNPEYTQQYIIDDAYVFNTGQTLNIPAEPATRYDGQIRQFHTVKSAVFNAEGNVVQTVGVSRDITERQQTEVALRRSEAQFRELAQREELLNRLASQIRSSLDLNTILETAVHESRNLLNIDKCFFLWYRPDTSETPYWEVVREAKNPDQPSLLGFQSTDAEIGPISVKTLNKEIIRIDDVQTLPDIVTRQFFLSLGFTAVLSLPVHTQAGKIGVFSCTYSGGVRPWRDSEVELLLAIVDQLAIAIDQAELYKQSRTAAATAQAQTKQLEQTLQELRKTQSQLVQTEKMSSLGQMVAGIAHEINNPVNFIYGNLIHVSEYTKDLLNLIQLYQQQCPPLPNLQAEEEAIDLDFLIEDLPKILSSMKMGADRIRQIVLSLRNFSRLDEAEMKRVNIHEGIESTLLILQNRLKAKPDRPEIQVVKNYGNLPLVECYAGQLNQVFMNLLANAIDVLEIETEKQKKATSSSSQCPTPQIQICTEVSDSNHVVIYISDNGSGMTEEVRQHLFDPFFTTKPVGKGTGLGLSIAYQIVVEKHQGQLRCISSPGEGAMLAIAIPIEQANVA